jgi:hypothetical protein
MLHGSLGGRMNIPGKLETTALARLHFTVLL